MSGATRHTIDLVAAAAIVMLPFVVIAIGRWAGRGPSGRSVPLTEWLVWPLALLSGAAGFIHLLVIEPHMAESRLHAAMFAGLAAFQLIWAVWYGARPGRGLALVALAVNTGAIFVWAVSRTTGLPGWLEGDGIEPMALADLACTAMELLLVGGLLALTWRPFRVRVGSRSVSRTDAGLGMAMLVLAVTLVTGGAIASVATGGHAHVADHEHEAGVHGSAG